MAKTWVQGPEPELVKNYGSEPDQLVEFYGNFQSQESTQPTIALIHGGYWRPANNREHMRALAAKIANHGYLVANIEYRREPLNPEVTMQDIQSALQTIENPVALIGFSVGGQLALINSESIHEIHKLILLAPVTDLERTKAESLGEDAVEAFFGQEELTKYDPMKRDYHSHLFIIHGDCDQRVPIAHSRDFAKAKGASLMEISGADHFDVIDPAGLAFELIINALA